jgi:hypothetical protein
MRGVGCEALCATQPGNKARTEANKAKKRGRRGKFHLCPKKKQLSVPEESNGWKQNVHSVKTASMRMTKETYLLSKTLDIRSRCFMARKNRRFGAKDLSATPKGNLPSTSARPEGTGFSFIRPAALLHQGKVVDVGVGDGTRFISANRTCELGMRQATGRAYESFIYSLEEATRAHE